MTVKTALLWDSWECYNSAAVKAARAWGQNPLQLGSSAPGWSVHSALLCARLFCSASASCLWWAGESLTFCGKCALPAGGELVHIYRQVSAPGPWLVQSSAAPIGWGKTQSYRIPGNLYKSWLKWQKQSGWHFRAKAGSCLLWSAVCLGGCIEMAARLCLYLLTYFEPISYQEPFLVLGVQKGLFSLSGKLFCFSGIPVFIAVEF